MLCKNNWFRCQVIHLLKDLALALCILNYATLRKTNKKDLFRLDLGIISHHGFGVEYKLSYGGFV